MRWPIMVRQVAGQSMEPEIMSGQFILVSAFRKPKVGSIVVAKTEGREVIKRVTAIDKKLCTLEGDNRSQSNSYIIPKRAIKGVRIL